MNIINTISIQFTNPWLLFLLIPAILLTLIPFFRLKIQHRKNRYRITSLVLRVVAVIFAVFIISGINFRQERITLRDDIIILVDSSGSTRLSADRINDQIKAIIDESNGEYNIGIITFANGNIYNIRMTNEVDNLYDRYINSSSRPEESSTNIAVALSYAKSQLPNPQKGRIILLSDGLETDESALSVIRDISKSGVRIDTIYFSPNSHYFEAQINTVTVPNRVNVGETVEFSVEIQSTVSGAGILSVYDNNTLIYQEPIQMNGYAETFVLEHMFNVGGLHELYFEIDSEYDTVAENNSYYAYVNIDSTSNILVIDGTGNESDFLVDLLSNDHAVTVLGVNSSLPASTTALQVYDEIILMNVANGDLPNIFVQLLDIYVNDLGGGLLTIGGNKAYVEGDMSGTGFEAMLPVLSSTSARPLAVMYVLDSSGSMNDMIGTTGKTRFELAKDGAIESVNALSDRDYFGLVSFNSVANVAIPLTPATQKENIIQSINELQTASGTMYKAGLELAASALKTMSDAYMKHIIFITDGTATDNRNEYTAVVEGFSDFNITMSGIAIYRSDFFTSHIVQELTEIGGGRYYYVQNAAELPAIMLTESTVSGIEYINEGIFTPSIVSHTSVVTGVDILPELGGYYGTLLKEDATMVLSSNEGLPIYASWQYGSGRVGSFTSDLSGYWSSNYFVDNEGITLIRNMVTSLFPAKSMEERNMVVDFAQDNYATKMNISTQLQDEQTLTARVTDPNGNTISVMLNDLSASNYLGNFETNIPGIYTVAISKRNASNQVVDETFFYTTFSYSEEYNVFADSFEGFKLLEEIAELGNGKILYLTDGMFTEEAQAITQTFDPKYLFLSIMITAVILDIFSRKFKFLWPHEFVKQIYLSKKDI
jgi:Ca-activated chloride channel homolog